MKKKEVGTKARSSKQPTKTQIDDKRNNTKKKGIKIFSISRVRVPLSNSPMLILPSLHLEPSDEQASTTDILDTQSKENSSQAIGLGHQPRNTEDSFNPEAPSSAQPEEHSQVNLTKDAKSTPLTPSHHLSPHNQTTSHNFEHHTTLPPKGVIHDSQTTPTHHIPTNPSTSNNSPAKVTDATVSVDETDTTVTTSGTLTSIDIDNQNNTFTPDSITGTHGDLTIDAHGHWIFTANSAFNQLNVGDKVEETFTVTSVDGTPSTIKVTINGTNDAATVSSATVAVDETDKAVTTSGTLTSTDVDNPDNAFTASTQHGTHGDLTIDANGHWVFTANNAFNQLNVGQKVEETFTITSIDGTPSTIKVTINGTNDAATVSSATVAVDETDKAVTTSGTLTSTDVDNPDNAFTASTQHGSNGDLTIDANGHWVFTANSAFNQLNVGDKVEETFTVTSVDGTQSTVKVTINGTNDAATVSSATVAVDETDQAVTTSGTLTSTDVDNPDNTFTPDSITGTNGDLAIDGNGHWVFTANSAFNQLNFGDKVEETFTVTSIDGTPSTIKVTINGTNDAATVSSATVAVDETDKPITTSGTLTSTDIDNPDNSFTPASITGTHGDLTIDANGHWIFTANSAFNQLNVGDKVEETFTVTSVDGTPSTIKVTINGTNDAATVSSTTVAVDETDTTITTSGNLTSTDVDNPDNTFTPASIAGNHGDLTIDSNGHWVFTANSAFNQLNVGDKVEETFTVASVDGTQSTIKVTINGTNDAATVSSATVAVDETDKAVTTSGTLTSIDVDNPDNTFTPDSISGTHGDLTIDANGHWVFTANSAFNQLNVGDKVEETFTVASVDGTQSTIKVTINGTNDAATVSSATVAVDETDKAVTTSGTLTSIDVDNPDNAFTPDSISGTHGDLTIDANGHWVFTANSAFNQLNVGDKVEETFTVTSIDGTPSTIKVTINGTNDAATVSSATVAVDETDTAITTSGTLTSTDVDNPDNTFTPDTIIGNHGDLTIDAHGHWVFTANSAFNQLNVGDNVEETFTVTSVDGTPSTIKVTINGTNDAAMVSSATVAVDETDTAITTSGTLTSTDVDNPDNTFTPDTITGTHGDLTIDANGHWVFTANSAFNQLNVGDKVEETFTVASVDGTPSTIKVTINGTNDSATVSSATVAVDETDKAITTSGTLTSTDVDNPDNTFTPDTLIGNHGDLTIDANGHWVFTANSAFNQLNVGDKVEETFTVTSVDGTPSTIKVTINGTNDAATVSSATVAVDETDKAVTTSGTLTSTDVDNPDNAFTASTQHGSNGDLTIDANGHWVFTANSAFNQLNVGDKVEETFTVTSVDGTPSTIKVTINGTNDAATVSSATVAVDETDTAITTSGILTSTDVDNPDNTFTPDSITGTHGDLTIDAHGHWVFTANSAFNQLNVGNKVEETFTVASVDGTPSTIKVTINGTNDAATVSSATIAVDETDSAVTTSGTLTSTDVDNPNNTFTPDTITGTNGDLTIDANGHWVFTANSAFNQLNVGDKVEETFTVTSVDGTPSTIKVTINGTNDAATVSSATVAVDETDSAITASGTLTSTDVDNPDNTFTPDTITGTNGDLTIDANGHWVFTANSAFNQLNVGDKVEETFTVTSVDGTPSTIKVTINGTNDAATVSSATVAVNETDSATTTSGNLTSTDVDNPDNAFTPDSITGTHGDLTIDSNGHWVFTANSAFNQLNAGDKVEESFTVTSVDGTQSTIKVTINGTNDCPTISGTSSGAVIEQGFNTAGTPDATGSLTATDLDKSDTVTWAINQPQGQWGTLSIDQNGHWHYQLDNSTGGAADKLAAGEHQSESFWITATDSAGATVPHKIVIDVQGSNDKPIVSAWTQLPAGKEDQPVTIKASDLLTHASDVDSSDVLHVTNLQATHGHLVDNKDGTYTFTPDKDFNGEIRLTYDVVDGHGGSVSTQAKFDLTATPDNAIITDAQTNADLRGVTEDRGYIDTHYQLHYDGKLNIQDPDAGEAQFDPNIGPQTYQGIGYDTKLGGHILLMRDGHYTYTLDNRNIQNLAQGEVKHDSAVIRSADGTTHTIELTVHGTNDAPTINAQSHSVTEGGSVLNGQMVGQDIDTGATLTYSAPQIDGLVVNPDGSYSFNPAHSSYQSLASGVTKTLTVPVTVTDEHNASSTQNLSITITGVNNSAVIGGVDTGDVTEGNAGQNMSPDYAQPGMAHLVRSTIDASGKLTIADTDTGEAEFDTHGLGFNYSGQYGDLLLRKDGTWFYHADTGQIRSTGGLASTRGTAIDQLGENQTLTDTITVYSKDGTSHDIVITIHGSNDRPYCASEVQLNSGKEDQAQTITATELLTNTVDVDANDAGKLTIANLHADHGSIQDNHDGTFTFTPSHNYNGSVHFTYDVKDAHGGTTHTGANTTLAATSDKAIISEVTTGSVIEDGAHATHNNGTTTELANGQLQVIDPDSGEDKFQYSQFGETRIHDPFGGMLRIDSAGNWGYSVDNAALQHLAQGQVETVTYRVHSFDGTAYDLNIDVVGTNDAPTVTKVVLSNGTEDTNYQMQASQFGFTDIDTGDTLHSIAITHLPPAAQGKFVLDGHDITAGQSITASNIAKLQFVPTPNFNGDVQFKFTVSDGHVDSQEATNTLHIDAVSDAAQFTGRDTGNVHEGHTYTAPDGSMSGGYVDDRSPDHMHGNIGKIWNDEIHTDGHLNIVDPDSGESHAQTGTYQGTHGHVILQSNGDWSYYASIGQDATGRKIDHLGQGESITDTVTVKSADGTTHDIHITIHGDNDRPYCSSEVQLNSGKEDLAQTITTTELLANTVDVDANDAGQLSIANLRADHGTLVDNKDGTFTFTPDHNFNGKVHFTYDVKDAHGGVTHTGASTTLLPSNDAATLQPTLASNFVTEDHLKSGTSTNELWSGWKNLDIQDIDSPSEAKITQIEVNGVKHTVPANFAMNLAGVHGTFNFTHSTDGHDKWSYSADNSHTEVQSLSHGESLTDTITLITADGTRIPLTAKILGTDDHVIIDTPDALTAALGTAVEDKVTSISGTLLAHDSDSKDSVTFTAGNSVGSYGTLHVDSDGQWHYDLDHSKANVLQQGETKAEGFDITATSTDGSTTTKHIEVLVQGSSDTATISVMSNPDVHEDSSSTPVEMISGKLSALDPDHDQSAFSTDVGKRHDPFNSGVHGGLHISKDGSWTYSVNNSQIQQLAAGQEEHVQYNVHTVGGDYHIIDIKIVGTNDIPTVSATTLAHGTEDTHYQMQASQFGFNDVDTGDTLHSIAITDLPPAAQGKFVLDGHDVTTGQSISASDIAKLQFVPALDFNGDVQFKFTVNDGHANSAEATNTLHIDAVSDAATITGIDSGSVTEDSHLQTSGSLTVTDPDSGEAHFTATSGSTQLGTYTIDASGHWTYSLNPRIQSLHQGETTPDVFTVHSADGTAHVIKVTITGTQDVPVITGQSTGTVYEDAQTTISGTLNADDKDYGQSGFWAQSHIASAHNFGDLSIDQNGYWTFHLDSTNPAVNALGEHDTLQETVTVNTIDGTSKVIQITIHGTNDAPVLGVSQTSSTTGTLTETDVDVSDTHTFSVVHATGQFGSLSVDPDSGAYVYTTNGSVAGMSYNTATHTYHGSDVFEVKVSDGHTEDSKFITFDANGHVSVVPGQSPTISTSVPSNPLVTTTQPSLPTGTNTPPNNSVTVDLAASSDTGTSDTDNLTKDSTPTITGHTDIPYSQVTIYDGSTPIGHAVSDGSGQYSVAVTSLSNGDHNLSAKALAPSSVLPATSSILPLHVDTVVAPLQVSLTHDTGSNLSDLITSDGSLTITGQETGATVEYSTDNGHTWTSSFTPQQGSNTVSVRQTDAAGNVSPDTSVTFTLDNAIAAPAVSLRNDTGRHSVNTPDLITKDSQLTIQTEAGAKVEYSNDGGHTWTAVFNPVEGVNDLQVRQTDIAGNVSPVTHFSFTLDTTPGTVTVNPISQDNALNAVENNQSLVITGTTSNIAPGDAVYVVIGNQHFYDATVKPDGTWSLTLSPSIHQNIMATDRDYSIQVGTVDTAGNSTPRISTHLLVDTQSPIPHIAVDSVTQDNVLNALESGQTIAITGTVTGDYHTGDIVSLKINGATISSLTGSVDSSGHFSIPVAGNILEHANIHTSYANGQSGSIHSIEATIITTDAVGNIGSATTGSQIFSVDTHVSLPTITFENPGPDGLYSKAEIAHGHPNTVTATITPPGDAKVGEHLVVNGQDHVLDAHTLQHGLQVEVNPGSQVQVTMTDEHGNTAGSQGVAASAIPEPIVVKPPSGSHQVSGTLGVPPLVPSQTPVPSAQNGWRIHLPNGQYVTSHHGQYGTLTIDPQTGHLHYQEQAQVHTGPHGSASGIGQHEDKFEIALQGTNQDEVVAHVNVQILSHGPGHSGKLTIGTEVVDMTITPIVHASHPAPPPPPPVQHDEPEIASHEDFTFTVSEDTSLDLSQHAHQEPDQKTDHHGAAAYLDALGIQPNASPSTGHDQPADMDIVLAQVDQQHAVDYDQTHLDMSDALEHHDAANNHNQDDEHHHHNDVDGLPDIDPNN
ncbi:VCBS domain-containing protein [Vibrio fortis]|uniref:VCBS domain-containing protein n=1 Tax=Vibrio fortis TaxID=212667 RepID=UPI003EC0B19C